MTEVITNDQQVDYSIDRTYESTVRAKWCLDGAKTLAEAAKKLRDFADELEKMDKAGVTLLEPISDDYGFITTENKEAAKEFEFFPQAVELDEDEFLEGSGVRAQR